jgi:hypothetical protein
MLIDTGSAVAALLIVRFLRFLVLGHPGIYSTPEGDGRLRAPLTGALRQYYAKITRRARFAE